MSAKLFAKKWVRRLLSRTIKPHTVIAGPLKGCRLHTSWHDYPGALLGTTERPLLDWLSRNVKIGEVWLDVGAHYGYVSLALCRLVGPSGHVFAFEPVSITAESVRRMARLNNLVNLTVVNYALGEAAGLEPRGLGLVRGMADLTLGEVPDRCEILVTSLDSLWPAIAPNGTRINGVKIDIQGMEIEALRGMRRLLSTHRPKLVIEPHINVDRQALIKEVVSSGYQSDFAPIDPRLSSNMMVSDQSYVFCPLSSVAATHSMPENTSV